MSIPGPVLRRPWRTPKRHVGRTLALGCVGALFLLAGLAGLAFSQCGKQSRSGCVVVGFQCATVNSYPHCDPQPCATSFGGLTVHVDRVQWNSSAKGVRAGKQLLVLTLHFENRGVKPQSTDLALKSFTFFDANADTDKPIELAQFPWPDPVDLAPAAKLGPVQVGFEVPQGLTGGTLIWTELDPGSGGFLVFVDHEMTIK